jgi:hypothetical protein
MFALHSEFPFLRAHFAIRLTNQKPQFSRAKLFSATQMPRRKFPLISLFFHLFAGSANCFYRLSAARLTSSSREDF